MNFCFLPPIVNEPCRSGAGRVNIYLLITSTLVSAVMYTLACSVFVWCTKASFMPLDQSAEGKDVMPHHPKDMDNEVEKDSMIGSWSQGSIPDEIKSGQSDHDHRLPSELDGISVLPRCSHQTCNGRFCRQVDVGIYPSRAYHGQNIAVTERWDSDSARGIALMEISSKAGGCDRVPELIQVPVIGVNGDTSEVLRMGGPVRMRPLAKFNGFHDEIPPDVPITAVGMLDCHTGVLAYHSDGGQYDTWTPRDCSSGINDEQNDDERKSYGDSDSDENSVRDFSVCALLGRERCNLCFELLTVSQDDHHKCASAHTCIERLKDDTVTVN
jgi:hypothetical protein